MSHDVSFPCCYKGTQACERVPYHEGGGTKLDADMIDFSNVPDILRFDHGDVECKRRERGQVRESRGKMRETSRRKVMHEIQRNARRLILHEDL